MIKIQLTIALAFIVAAAHAGPGPAPILLPATGLDTSPAMRLAVALLKEGDWSASRTEFRRVLKSDPDDGAAALLCAIAESRMGRFTTNSLDELCTSPKLPTQAQLIARCELADVLLRNGQIDSAFEHFSRVFLSSGTASLLGRSARSLALILDQHPRLARAAPELVAQLETCSVLWRNSPSPGRASRRESWTGLPMEWTVSFYRAQISPAIGRRCSLSPSCSEYAMQALRRHGLLGLAIYADRAVREPDVVKLKKDPVQIGDRWRYRDTLAEHDSWLTRR